MSPRARRAPALASPSSAAFSKSMAGGSSCATRREDRHGERGAWMRLRFAAERRDAEAATPKPQAVRCSEQVEHGVRYSDRRRRGRYPRSGRRHSAGRGLRDAHRARQRRRARARSRRAGRTWCSSTSGCRAAGSTACSCSTPSRSEHPELPVVMISGHGNIETAVAAIKRGAYDFIEKPFKADRLVLVADRALETSRLKREVKELKQLAPLPIDAWSAARRRSTSCARRSRRSRRPTAAS